MNCDICHKETMSGSHITRGHRFEVRICPNCLMWSDDQRAVIARETVSKFKLLRERVGKFMNKIICGNALDVFGEVAEADIPINLF